MGIRVKQLCVCVLCFPPFIPVPYYLLGSSPQGSVQPGGISRLVWQDYCRPHLTADQYALTLSRLIDLNAEPHDVIEQCATNITCI